MAKQKEQRLNGTVQESTIERVSRRQQRFEGDIDKLRQVAKTIGDQLCTRDIRGQKRSNMLRRYANKVVMMAMYVAGAELEGEQVILSTKE